MVYALKVVGCAGRDEIAGYNKKHQWRGRGTAEGKRAVCTTLNVIFRIPVHIFTHISDRLYKTTLSSKIQTYFRFNKYEQRHINMAPSLPFTVGCSDISWGHRQANYANSSQIQAFSTTRYGPHPNMRMVLR